VPSNRAEGNLSKDQISKVPESDQVPDDSFNNNNNATESVTKKADVLPVLTPVSDSGILERPSLLSQKSCDSDGMKINRLSSPSPVLGSPSVVMKARSLFDAPDSVPSPESSEKRPEGAQEPSLPQVGSISKIRHSFEKSHSSSTITTKSHESEVQKLSSDRTPVQQRKEPEPKP